jgi:hypothetical protein
MHLFWVETQKLFVVGDVGVTHVTAPNPRDSLDSSKHYGKNAMQQLHNECSTSIEDVEHPIESVTYIR